MNPAELVRFLADTALVGPAELTRPDFAVRDLSRRNRNWAVTWDAGQSGYFVKSARDADHAATLAHEARFLRRFAQSPGRKGWQGYLPVFVDHGEMPDSLVLRFEAGRATLREKVQEQNRIALWPATATGRFLGALHRSGLDGLEQGFEIKASDRAVFGLTFDCPDQAILRGPTAGAIAVLKAVQSSDLLRAHYPFLRAQWQAECLIHSDLRWENLLVSRKGGRSRLLVVDWELVTLGDPAWDLATVWSEHLTCWLRSIPLAHESHDELHVSLAGFQLEPLKQSIARFRTAYDRTRRLSIDQRIRLLERSIAYLPARLAQSAFEWSNSGSSAVPHSILAVQMAENIINQPHAAAAQLLGIAIECEP